MKIIRLRLILLLVLLAAGTGCTRWHHQPLPAPEAGPASFGAVRLTPRATGMMVVLRDAQVTPDSVTGWGHGVPNLAGEPAPGRTRVALPRDQVLVFESRVSDPWATAGATVLTILAAYAAVAAYVVTSAW